LYLLIEFEVILFWFSVFTDIATYEIPAPYTASSRELFGVGNKTAWNTNSQNLSHYCPNCGKGYTWKSNLTRHLRLECGKAPQQQCPYCPYITNHKCVLQKHIQRHHKDMPNIP
jgi:uncharacterized Zn-finger protein